MREIDIVPASGVAVSALINAVKDGIVKKDEVILLNITGGGEKKLGQEKKTYNVQPKVISKNITDKEIEELLCPVLKKNS